MTQQSWVDDLANQTVSSGWLKKASKVEQTNKSVQDSPVLSKAELNNAVNDFQTVAQVNPRNVRAGLQRLYPAMSDADFAYVRKAFWAPSFDGMERVAADKAETVFYGKSDLNGIVDDLMEYAVRGYSEADLARVAVEKYHVDEPLLQNELVVRAVQVDFYGPGRFTVNIHLDENDPRSGDVAKALSRYGQGRIFPKDAEGMNQVVTDFDVHVNADSKEEAIDLINTALEYGKIRLTGTLSVSAVEDPLQHRDPAERFQNVPMQNSGPHTSDPGMVEMADGDQLPPVDCGNCGFGPIDPVNVGSNVAPLYKCPKCGYISEPADFPDSIGHLRTSKMANEASFSVGDEVFVRLTNDSHFGGGLPTFDQGTVTAINGNKVEYARKKDGGKLYADIKDVTIEEPEMYAEASVKYADQKNDHTVSSQIYVSTLVQPDGNLEFIVDPETKKRLQQFKNSDPDFESDEVMRRVLESALADDFWWVLPEEVGALTSAPILSDGTDIWWYPNYELSSPQRDLAEKGRSVFSVERAQEKGVDTQAGAHQAWDVILDGKVIDTVFYGDNAVVDEDEVKRSLVNHDGYDSNIVVKKRASLKQAADPTPTAVQPQAPTGPVQPELPTPDPKSVEELVRRRIKLEGEMASINSQIEKLRGALMSSILPLQQQVGAEEPALVEALKKLDDMSIMVDGWKAMVSKAFDRTTPKYKDILTKIEEVAEEEVIPRIVNLIKQLKGMEKYNTTTHTPERLMIREIKPQKESSFDGWNFGKEAAPATQKLKEWWAQIVGWFKRTFVSELDQIENSIDEINEYLEVLSTEPEVAAPATASLKVKADYWPDSAGGLDWTEIDKETINPKVFGDMEIARVVAAPWTLDADVRSYNPGPGWSAFADMVEINPITGDAIVDEDGNPYSEWWMFVATEDYE